MTGEATEAPELIGVGVQATVETAARLGLTWQLKLATVTDASPLQAIYDGDTAAIGMVSMVGTVVVDARVYVLVVPPSGNFIVGQITAQETGAESVSFGPAASFSVAITFAVPFASVPRVFVNINSAAGPTGGWIARAIGVTRTGFTLFLSGASSTFTNVEVQWFAVAP